MYRLHMYIYQFLLQIFSDDCVQGARTMALCQHTVSVLSPHRAYVVEGKADIMNDDDDSCEWGKETPVAIRMCTVTGSQALRDLGILALYGSYVGLTGLSCTFHANAVVNTIRYVHFLLIALLWYISYTIQSTNLNCCVQWFSLYSQSLQLSYNLVLEHFYHFRKRLHTQ